MSVKQRLRAGGVRGVLALVVAVGLAAGGGSAIGWAVTQQEHPPSVVNVGTLDGAPNSAVEPSTATPSQPSAAAGGMESAPADPPPLTLPPSPPQRLRIPAIGVDSTLQALGLNPDGTLQVPAPGPHYDEAAWFDGSPTPGELGPSVVEGHIDSAKNGPSVFFRLGAVRPGQQVAITRADGSTAVFTIRAVRRYPKDNFPTETVYGDTDHAALRLITCGGTFDRATGNYRDNTVVFADLTTVER